MLECVKGNILGDIWMMCGGVLGLDHIPRCFMVLLLGGA